MKKCLIISVLIFLSHFCFAQNAKTVYAGTNPSKSVTVYMNAGVFGDSVVHIIWENFNDNDVKEAVLEKSADRLNFSVIARTTVAALTDIHTHNYPEWINYFNNILLSSEHGNNRFIYNDVVKTKDAGKAWYRVKMLDFSGTMYVSQTINSDGSDNAAEVQYNHQTNNEAVMKGGGKTLCPPLGTIYPGETSTGQTQTFTSQCCSWTETLYHGPSSLMNICVNNSYAWCCANAPGASSCSTGYAADPCCYHYCNQYMYCSCTPWDCCSGNPLHWIITQSSGLTGMLVTANIQQPLCNNTNDGAITVNVSNAVSPVTYSWSNGGSTQTISNIIAGAYTVTITDSSDCSEDTTFIVTAANTINVIISSQKAHCNMSDGYAAVSVSGGSGSYTYIWNTTPPQTNDTIKNIPAGLYTVTISDGVCSKTSSVTVGNISAPIAAISYTYNPLCGAQNGYITVNVTGNAPPYSYIWNSNPPQYTKDLTKVYPGYYCLSVSDTNNCHTIVCDTITLSPFNPPAVCLVSVDTALNKNIVVWEKTSGTKSIDRYHIYRETVSPGVYTLAGVQSADSLSVFYDTASFPDQKSYKYKLAVFDSCGLESAQSLFHETIHLTASTGSNNNVNLSWNHYQGFTFNYYKILRGNSPDNLTQLNTVWNNINSYTDTAPPAGDVYYMIEVVKPTACNPTKVITATRSQILKTTINSVNLTANITAADCNNTNDGAITLNVNYAVPPLTFAWSNGATTQNLTNLPPGSYTVTVTDSLNNTADSTFNISAMNVITVNENFRDEHCSRSDGYAAVTASGGSGSFTYLWNTTPPQYTDTIKNIPAGVYTVTVSDGICSETRTITIGNFPAPVASVSGVTPSVCGTAAGAIKVIVSGGAPPYSFTWSSAPPQFTQDLANATPGYYCLSVTDTINCLTVLCDSVDAIPFLQPDICIVSVDTALNKNIVVWEKPNGITGINQYYIYRETAQSGIYSLAGSRSAGLLSSFTDTSSYPDLQSYKYKLAIYDTCGNISPQSAFHETIHLTANVGINNEVNLIWNHYIGFTFGTYNIYRGSSLSTLTLLASISGSNSSYTDLTPPAGNQYYLIEAVKPVACNPSKGISSTISDVLQLTIIGIPESGISKDIRIFPNPGSGSFTISLEGAVMKDVNCTVSNALGQNVYKGILDGKAATIDLTGVAKGIYILKLENGDINKVAGIVVE